MKRYFVLFLCLLFVGSLCAQRYDKLWAQAENAARKDLPKTAWGYLAQIKEKAIREGNDGQLLRAVLAERSCGEEVSPDSAAALTARMEQALTAEERPVVKALWHAALAQVYANQYGANRWGEEDFEKNEERARAHFEASLAQPDLLIQARTADYLPLFVLGNESKYFSDDLLHLFYRTYAQSSVCTEERRLQLLRTLIPLYEGTGNKDATLLLSLDSLEIVRKSRAVKGRIEADAYYQRLDALASQYVDRSLAVRVYEKMTEMSDGYDAAASFAQHNDSLLVAKATYALTQYAKVKPAAELHPLKAWLAQQTQHQARFEGFKSNYLPADSLKLTLRTRGVGKVQLRITRIFSDHLSLDRATAKEMQTLAQKYAKQAATYTIQLPSAAAWQWQEQQLVYAAPSEAGIYYAELVMDGAVCDHETFAVSSVQPIVLATAGRQNRITVVDAQTGQPLARATVAAYTYNHTRCVQTWHADSLGTVEITMPRSQVSRIYYASTPTDAASPSFSLTGYGLQQTGNATTERSATVANLFTDRAIYRPGQTVACTGVVFTRRGDDYKTAENFEALLTLYNVNRKVVDTLRVRTDPYGAFQAQFRLPETVLTGRFTLELKGGAVRQSKSIRVEEYKRPTFTAELTVPSASYALGDTVQVQGTAKTYSGIAVAGAKVKYTIARGSWFRHTAEDEPQTGETLTDADGKFLVPAYLQGAEDEKMPSARNWFYYCITYTVTAANGETAEGSLTLSAAAWKARFDVQMPAVICKEQPARVSARLLNASNQNISADAIYIIRSKAGEALRDTFRTGEAFALKNLQTLPSGNYELICHALPNLAADTTYFVLSSLTDTQPAQRENAFFAYSLPSEAKDSAVVVVGTKERRAVLFYDLLVGNEIKESRRYMLSDSLVKLQLAYQPAYGDGAKALFAMVRGGQLYNYEVRIQKPEPDKRLLLHWTSFRSRLTPGQAETWRLKVTHPDGTPASARVMARMYDASLDALASDPWNFSYIYFSRTLPVGRWYRSYAYAQGERGLYGAAQLKYLRQPQRSYTQWRSELFSAANWNAYGSGLRRGRGIRVVALYSVAERVAATSNVALDGMADAEMAEAKATAPAESAVQPRTNFAETAFFLPSLQTDAAGEVSLAFTLPETMTQWNFSALAHDQAMNNARLDTSIVVNKTLMVEPALPRFLRTGDKAELPVKVSNLSQKEVRATLSFSLRDALDEAQVVCSEKREVTLAAGESSVLNFAYTPTKDVSLLICRATAEGSGFADGEEHYLSVLSDEVTLTRTLPFSMTERGTYHFQTDTLFNASQTSHRRLTVEASSSPLWYAVSALPALADGGNRLSATEWATRYYALKLGHYAAEKNPALREVVNQRPEEISALQKIKAANLSDLTPWLREAEAEAKRTEALKSIFDDELSALHSATAVDKLAALQGTDGSWSWYPGMPGNNYITADVALLLARVQAITADEAADKLLQRACQYLRSEMQDQVERMKEEEQRTGTRLAPTEVQLRYLYLRALLGERPDETARFLLDRAETLRHALTMYGKAVCAVVFAKAGREDAAKLNLESLLEHTVSTPQMGRYFDTARAERSWQSYRIPTQCAAIEALQYLGRETEAANLRLWLLQSKRTQMWQTSRASTDAVFALLTAPQDSSSLGSLATAAPLSYTLKKGKSIVALSSSKDTATPRTAGYLRQSYSEKPATEATELVLHKNTTGLSWGSVYATFSLPASQVLTEGKGLRVERTVEVQRGTEWKQIGKQEQLHAGDRLRSVFTLTAAADYDFVALSAERPACFEPAQPLSGYAWCGTLPAYRAVKDAQTQFFIEHVSKGTHRLTEEYFATRTGHYWSGITHAECAYAPEFQATAASVEVRVE